ncbi:MAG TPA: SCP2 sterol-binding domain-containing protein [Candidatus Acidoferrales bacterium]|nr:SCP2 sterol-binding domain-containing protein [Candidatus Acidoferrales bacterium]
MSAFRDSQHAAEVLGGFFGEEGSVDDRIFAGSGIVVAYKLKDLNVRVVLDAREKPKPGGRGYDVYVNDPSAPNPDVEIWFNADTFDKLYRGEITPMALMNDRETSLRGDLSVSMRLVPAMAKSIPHYKTYREKHG